MQLNEYQKVAMSTLLPSANNHSYMLLGMGGEVGELQSVIAKAIRDGGTEATVDEKAKKELGDILWFVAGMAHVMGLTLEEVAEVNTQKLLARQQAGTLGGSGDDR